MEFVHPMHLRIGGMDIHPITEIIAPYVAAIKGAMTLTELQAVTEAHQVFAGDACDLANTMTEEDWPAYQWFNVIGRDPRFVGDEVRALTERFGAIMIPEQMLHISAMSGYFGVSDGLALICMAEQGMLQEVDGRAVITDSPKKEG